METASGERLFDMVERNRCEFAGPRSPGHRGCLREQLDRHLHVMVYGEYAQRRRTGRRIACEKGWPEPD